jgi:hypothetical protein
MTKRFLSALATAAVTTKMINTPAGRLARDAACLRWATGRAGNQSTGIG